MILLVVAVMALLALIVVTIRILWVFSDIRTAFRTHHGESSKAPPPPPPRRTVPIATVVVLGSGGHTTEMLQLLQSLNPQQYSPLTFIVAQTDTTSLRRVAVHTNQRTPDAIYHIPRSREVGQSYITSIATTLWSLIYTLGLVVRIRPGLVLCNGPGTCVPIAVWTFAGRLMGLWEGKIVFCESFCRVTRYVDHVLCELPSNSALIRFFVSHPLVLAFCYYQLNARTKNYFEHTVFP